MDTTLGILLVVVVVLVVGAAAWMLMQRRRSAELRDRFGPEYDRAVIDAGRRDAERRLSAVESQHEELDIKPLSEAARERYLEEWRSVEARFVNDPADAAKAADIVVLRALEERDVRFVRLWWGSALRTSRSTIRTWSSATAMGTRWSRTSTARRAPRTSGRRCSTSAPSSRTSFRASARPRSRPSLAISRAGASSANEAPSALHARHLR